MTRYLIGMDPGQSHDPTAIAVLERKEVKGAWDGAAYAYRKNIELRLRFLERVPLGTPYPEVVDRVARIAQFGELAGRSHLIVDGTGVGRPVVDLLKRARPGCRILPVIVTSGMQETSIGEYYRAPKKELIVGLQVMLQCGSMQVATTIPLGAEMMAEMAAVRVNVTESGREQYGASRSGEHDDLVFAVALACWGARKLFGSGENLYWTNESGERALGLLLRGM